MKVLCICPIGIGNYLLCYPAWADLKKRLPEAEIHLLALRKPIVGLAAEDPLWNAVHCIEPAGKPSPREQVCFILSMRKYRFDVSISFFPSNTWQYHLLPFLAGCRKRFGFRYPLKGMASLSWLSTHRISVNPDLHDVEQNRAIAAMATGSPASLQTEAVFPRLAKKTDRRKAETILDGNGPFFAIHPGSSIEHGMDAKRWAPERFGAIADLICKATGATALVLGGPDENFLKHKTAEAMTMPVRIVEPLPLPLTAALLKKCTFCLCNDSGIMHLAACNGVPVAAFFGPTDEKRNGPYGSHHCILRKPMDGFPLWTARNVGVRHLPRGTDPNRSLKALSVEDAWSQLAPFLARLRQD